MNDPTQLNEALELALKLSPKERIQLIERVASSVERDIEPAPPSTEHWGQKLVRLLDELGPIELVHPEIDDPVEWVKQIRRDEREQRLGDWGE